jgi:hypothetical protein
MATARTRTKTSPPTIAHNPAKPARRSSAAKTTTRQAAKRPAPASASAKTVSKIANVAKAVRSIKPPKADRPKLRLVRDSFTMPQTDHDLIGILKTRAITLQRPVKKSELLRGGLHALAALDDTGFRRCIEGLVPLKPGRPKKAG